MRSAPHSQPPKLTGSVACSHVGSSWWKWMLSTRERVHIRTSLKDSRLGERKGGHVCRICISL